MKIERRGVPWIERHMQGKVVRQVRIGDEQLAERDRVGFSSRQCLLGALASIICQWQWRGHGDNECVIMRGS
jgi:hypothetical protein